MFQGGVPREEGSENWEGPGVECDQRDECEGRSERKGTGKRRNQGTDPERVGGKKGKDGREKEPWWNDGSRWSLETDFPKSR